MNGIIIISIIYAIIAVTATLIVCVLKKKNKRCNIPFLALIWLLLYGTTIFLACFPGKKMSKDYFLGITQMLGGLFTVIGVYLTLIEEGKMREKENQDSLKQLKEQVRLDHIAFLKYDITYEAEPTKSANALYTLESREGPTVFKTLNIDIKNTGLGSAFNLSYQIIFGIKNEYINKPIVSILEPKDTYNEVIELEIPCDDENYYKRITLIIYYEDIYGNNYMQKLEGAVCTTYSIYDDKKEIDINLTLSSYEKAFQVENNHVYMVPKEEIEAEKEKTEYEELKKRLKEIISEEDQILVERIIRDYMSKIKYLSTIVEETITDITAYGGQDQIENYEKIRNQTYLVTYLEGIFENDKAKIYCRSIFKVNIKSEEIILISRKIDQSKSVLKKKNLRMVKRRLKKDFKNIKKQDVKYQMK